MTSRYVNRKESGHELERNGDDAQAENYPNRGEIDGEDYRSAPELWVQVDPEKKSR